MVESLPPASVKTELDEGDKILEVSKAEFNTRIKNKLNSPFLAQTKEWDDKELFEIPEVLIKGIKEELRWDNPSRIQSVAIPMIVKLNEETKDVDNMIAQAKNGAGKTGAFVIGSLLRVDPSISKPQVIVIGHTQELVNQTADVYKKVVKYAPDYKICNALQDRNFKDAQIIISTLGTILGLTESRGGLDLKNLRVLVIDEADDFFKDEKREQEVLKLNKIIEKVGHPVQKIFFSATYEHEISEKIANIVQEANQIKLELEKLQLTNIQQFFLRCESRGKAAFIKQIFDVASSGTKTLIFVNTVKFAETLFRILRDDDYRVHIIFGKMEKKEREEYIEKFRHGEVQIVITTDLLSRGFDMPTIQLVINFDVPQRNGKADYETYLHRIGRAGRFGTPGMSITLFDRDIDEDLFWDTIKHYKMEDKVQKLEGGAEQVETILKSFNEGF